MAAWRCPQGPAAPFLMSQHHPPQKPYTPPPPAHSPGAEGKKTRSTNDRDIVSANQQVQKWMAKSEGTCGLTRRGSRFSLYSLWVSGPEPENSVNLRAITRRRAYGILQVPESPHRKTKPPKAGRPNCLHPRLNKE